MKKQNAVLFCILLFILSGLLVKLSKKERNETETKEEYNRILYSWNINDIEEDENRFQQIIKEYQINKIYQDFTSEYLNQNDDTFIKKLSDQNITVYHLAGDPSWGQKGGFYKIAEEIDKVVNFNQNVTNPLKGIVLDIEPYVSEKKEEFQEKDFEIYVREIKKAYRYIANKNLELILAIPYWFDKINLELLEELIQNTDGISVMNYNINRTKENIEVELKLTHKYEKEIDTIYEIAYQEDGYFKEKEEIKQDFVQILNNEQKKQVNIAYHHYRSMK